MGFRRFCTICLLFVAVLALPARAEESGKIVVASKIDTEGALLGNLVIALLQNHGYAIENRIEIGTTKIVRQALLSGQVDIYPEYTGNGAYFFHMEGDPVWTNAQAGYETVRRLDAERNDLDWLTPAPVNNSWAIAVSSAFATGHHLVTLDDFARYVNSGRPVKLAASAEFVESVSGLPAFQRTYGFELAQSQLLVLAGGDTAATIRAAAEGISGVNAAMAYSTDGAIAVLKMVVLDDTKGAQIVYAPCLVMRGAVLRAHPDLQAILDPPFAGLTIDTLRQLSARISVEGEEAAAVAQSYLKQGGSLK
jgi:osmoprotectant transport system substrate-binding protein